MVVLHAADGADQPAVVGLVSHSRPWGPEQREKGLWEVVERADGSEVVGLWPAIVERERWEAVCAWFKATAAKRGGDTARSGRPGTSQKTTAG